jgi:hypothetical protein
VRSKLKQFPEIVRADIDTKTQRAYFEAKPSFDQYVALAHALEEAGGAIQMFHPKYLKPKAYYAMLGVKERTFENQEALQKALDAVPGVRSALIDSERWFTNEKGTEVGGLVVFADENPKLTLQLARAAEESGYIIEMRDHGHNAVDSKEWSEMNHAFAGVCLLFLAVCGMLQIGLKNPPPFIRYGTVLVWLAMFVFLFIRADRGSWPLGPLNWFEAFQEWDTAQHRVGVGLVLLIGIGDFLRLRQGWRVNPALGRWGILIVGVVGSGMLYSHLHQTIDPAHYQLVWRMNAQHVAMATVALLFCVTKFVWDTWQWPRRGGPYVSLTCLLTLGLILTLYVE